MIQQALVTSDDPGSLKSARILYEGPPPTRFSTLLQPFLPTTSLYDHTRSSTRSSPMVTLPRDSVDTTVSSAKPLLHTPKPSPLFAWADAATTPSATTAAASFSMPIPIFLVLSRARTVVRAAR